MNKDKSEPYAAFGARIKFFREQWQQTVNEVSTTLEIEEETLQAIESGKILPEDDLLEMIISHFLLTEEQATQLRSLVEVDDLQAAESLASGLEEMLMKQVVMYLPVDNRIVYTDSMNATVNKHGVVLQFLQSAVTKDGKPMPVSQVGMSREHVEKMIKVIQSTLDHHDKSQENKSLRTPKDKTNQ